MVSPAVVVAATEELEEEEIDEEGGAGVSPAEEESEGGAGVSPAEEEEIEVVVKRFEHNGVKWLRDSANVIYNMETQEEVGVWDEEAQTIVMNA